MTLPRGTNFNMEQLITRRPFDEGNPVSQDMLAPTNQLLLGATLRTATAFGKAATVKAGEDIRPALNSLKSAGGGTLILLAGVHRPTYDIVGDSKISIIGEGIDQTIVDFGSSNFAVKYEGTALSIIENFKIENLTVKNSGNTTAALIIDHCDFWGVSDVKLTSNAWHGVKISHSQSFLITNVTSFSNTGGGFVLDDAPGGDTPRLSNFTFTNCKSTSNGKYGFLSQTYTNGTFIRCEAVSNGEEGFNLLPGLSSDPEDRESELLACTASSNSSSGFVFRGSVRAVACIAKENTGWGFDCDGVDDEFIITFSACQSISNTTGQFRSPGPDAGEEGLVSISACAFGDGSVQPSLEIQINSPRIQNTSSLFNSLATKRDLVWMKNTSGGNLAAGNVVIMKSVASGEEVTTTTTAGDDQVLGIKANNVNSTTTPNNAWFAVQQQGFTDLLKVNGTTDIAIGDFLSTYTVAGIAAKARPGDQVFAIALEAYTTNDSNGVIDAYILPWRFPLVEYSDLKEIEVSSLNYKPVEALESITTTVGNVGTGEDNLQTYTLPANSLENTGEAVRIKAWGSFANNGNAKTLKLYFGSENILNISLETSTSGQWEIESTFVRTGASAQKYTANFLTVGTAAGLNIENGTASETLSSSVVIKCTGEATANDDIVQEGMIIELLHQ